MILDQTEDAVNAACRERELRECDPTAATLDGYLRGVTFLADAEELGEDPNAAMARLRAWAAKDRKEGYYLLNPPGCPPGTPYFLGLFPYGRRFGDKPKDYTQQAELAGCQAVLAGAELALFTSPIRPKPSLTRFKMTLPGNWRQCHGSTRPGR